MTFTEFRKSLDNELPPSDVSEMLKAMWHDGKGDWNTAHQVAQDTDTRESAWVHAYLHRKEGDQSNASYWYHRAQKPMPAKSLADEWESIVKELIALGK